MKFQTRLSVSLLSLLSPGRLALQAAAGLSFELDSESGRAGRPAGVSVGAQHLEGKLVLKRRLAQPGAPGRAGGEGRIQRAGREQRVRIASHQLSAGAAPFIFPWKRYHISEHGNISS